MIKSFCFFSFLLLMVSGCTKTMMDPGILDVSQDTFRYETSKLVMGVDLSYVNAVQDFGGVFKDSTDKKVDPFVYLHSKGANVVRVRLWHNPSWQNTLYGNIKYHHLADVTESIRRAKAAGMSVCLDIHYSDNWADPAKQETPKAWQNAGIQVLRDSIYRYTTSVLVHLKNKNLTPEFIQIGNENNAGMCLPTGKISGGNFNNFGQLLSSGISAVRDFSTSSIIKPQIILHVAQLQNASWWANGVVTQAGITDFDILGISHYSLWSTINKNEDIKKTIATLKSKFNKKIMVVEIAYPWTPDSKDTYSNILSGSAAVEGYPITKQGQYEYMKDFTQAVIDGGGSGVMYWEPCWISSNLKDQWNTGSSWENCTFFDFSGKPLPVIKYMTTEYQF